jgi:hypothetical protein
LNLGKIGEPRLRIGNPRNINRDLEISLENQVGVREIDSRLEEVVSAFGLVPFVIHE